VTETIENRLVAFWRHRGVRLRAGVPSADLAAFEARHQLSLPFAVASFYREANGTTEGDEELFEVWPLEDVGTVRQVVAPHRGTPDYGRICDTLPDADSYFAFADCMIWSQVFAVRMRPKESTTQVVWISGAAWAVVAPTFEAFWEQYLVDPAPVLHASQVEINAGAG
jgi:hypothetical protein